MLMTYIWLGMAAASVLFGAASGRLDVVSAAVTEGAGAAVTLCLGIAGAMCLWSGVLEAMERGGLLRALTRLLRPLLRRIYPRAAKADPLCADAAAANFTANLLGLGNAATPAGLRTAARLAVQGTPGEASNELCRLVVMNTASVQLIPATVAAVRASLGAAAPFDILPCVWASSLCSVAAGLLAARIFERLGRR